MTKTDDNPMHLGGISFGAAGRATASTEFDRSAWHNVADTALRLARNSGAEYAAVGRLWHIGASTYPGAGLGGGSGHLVATTLTRRRAWRR